MKYDLKTVLILLFLGFVWGSAFILMHEGSKVFNFWQMASLRLIFAGSVAIFFFVNIYKKVAIKDWKFLILSGLLGNFIPAYLFASVSHQIPSSLSGALNALTPLFALIFGFFIFKTNFNIRQVFGIIIGFVGAMILIFSANSKELSFSSEYIFPCIKVVIASALYGINVNIIKSKLNHNSAITNSMIPLTLISFPAVFIAFKNDLFYVPIFENENLIAWLCILVLGVIGSAFSLIFFNKLVKQTTALFAASVTYLIPFFAYMWGLIFGEILGFFQIMGMVLILTGIIISK